MEAQPTLFDRKNPEGNAADLTWLRQVVPSSAPAEERSRLSKQSGEILARLRRGPATNAELAGIALKYTSRISDLRRAGYRIVVCDRDHASGLCWYRVEAP